MVSQGYRQKLNCSHPMKIGEIGSTNGETGEAISSKHTDTFPGFPLVASRGNDFPFSNSGFRIHVIYMCKDGVKAKLFLSIWIE